jgi:hypothetical protein
MIYIRIGITQVLRQNNSSAGLYQVLAFELVVSYHVTYLIECFLHLLPINKAEVGNK